MKTPEQIQEQLTKLAETSLLIETGQADWETVASAIDETCEKIQAYFDNITSAKVSDISVNDLLHHCFILAWTESRTQEKLQHPKTIAECEKAVVDYVIQHDLETKGA